MGFTFLYLPNVLIHEPNEFIHVRVVHRLSKFKFTVQRLSDLVLTYSVGKGDFWVVLPPGWNLLSVTVWCLCPGHCCSSTLLLCSLSTIFSTISLFPLGKSIFCVKSKRPCRDLTWLYPTEYRFIWVSLLTLNQRWHGLVSTGVSLEFPIV